MRVGRGSYAAVLAAQVEALKLTSADRCAWLLSPGFDASLSDVGVALLAGAALHTEAPGLLRDPLRLAAVHLAPPRPSAFAFRRFVSKRPFARHIDHPR